MTTFNELVVRVRQQLLGYAKDQEAQAELAMLMGPSDTTFQVGTDTVTSLSRGLVEVDDELILVKRFDPNSGIVTVMGGTNGRGQQGTAAASHQVNALITSSPAFPRSRIKQALNDTIQGLYPSLVAFGTTEITKLAPVYEYELPAEATGIQYVVDQLVGPTKIWQPGPNLRFNPRANPTDFPSGKSIQLFDFVTPGRAMRVTYTKAPAALAADADTFETVTGYPDRCVDMVVYGACARLLPAYDAARQQQQTVESTERANLVPPASPLRTAQYYQQMYDRRLQEEIDRQFYDTPFYQTFAGS